MMVAPSVPIREVIGRYIGGGWGKDQMEGEFREAAWVIRGTDIPSCRVGQYFSCPFRYHTESNLKPRRLGAGDLVMEVSGGSRDQLVGRPLLVTPAMLRHFGDSVIPASFCKLIRPDPARIDSAYLYYVLLALYDSGELRRFQVQSTGITNFQFEAFLSEQLVGLPALPTQRKISAILSAYDDLIEKNNRRVKLLEETAQRIYREWFIDFRYPDHETVPLRASAFGPIPDGWEVGSLGEVVDVNSRTAKSLEGFNSVEYIDISSVETGRVKARRKLLPGEAPGRARRLLQDGDTIWSTVRPNLRAYALIVKPAPSWLASTGFAVLSPKLVPMSFLYALVTDERFVSYLVNHATGSAYPAVTGSVFEKAPIVRPPAALLARYAELGDPALRLAAELRTADSVLASARDLLLPGLISGEIDVQDLDIEVPARAA